MADKKEVKSAPLLSTNKLETEIRENNLVDLGDTPFGKLWAEEVVSTKGKKTFINRYVYKEDSFNVGEVQIKTNKVKIIKI